MRWLTSCWPASLLRLMLVRGCRDRPVCLPKPGVQLTTLTHVEDVASMLASVPGNRAAIGQHYNVCSDRCITFTGGREDDACMDGHAGTACPERRARGLGPLRGVAGCRAVRSPEFTRARRLLPQLRACT